MMHAWKFCTEILSLVFLTDEDSHGAVIDVGHHWNTPHTLLQIWGEIPAPAMTLVMNVPLNIFHPLGVSLSCWEPGVATVR